MGASAAKRLKDKAKLAASTARSVCDFSLKTVMEVCFLVLGLLIVFDVVGVGAHFNDYGGVGIYSPSFVLNAKHSAGYMTGCAASSLLREDTIVQTSCAWIYGVLAIPQLGGQLNGFAQFGGLATWGNLLNGTSPGYRNVTRGVPPTAYGQGWVGLQYASLIFLILVAIVVTLINLWMCAATVAPAQLGWAIRQTDEFRFSYAAAEGEARVDDSGWNYGKMVKAIGKITASSVGVGAMCREWSVACRSKFGAFSLLMQLCSIFYGTLVMAEAVVGICGMLYPNAMYFPTYDSPQFTLSIFMGALSREVTYMFADTRLMFRRPMLIVFLWVGTSVGVGLSTAAFIFNQQMVNLSGRSPAFPTWCARTPACYAALASSGGPFVDWGAATYYYLGGVSPLYAYWSTLASYFELFMLVAAWCQWTFQSCRMIMLGCSYSVDLNEDWNLPKPEDVRDARKDEEMPLLPATKERTKAQLRQDEINSASHNWFWILCSFGKDVEHQRKVKQDSDSLTEQDPGKYCDIFWWCNGKKSKPKGNGMWGGRRSNVEARLQSTADDTDDAKSVVSTASDDTDSSVD